MEKLTVFLQFVVVFAKHKHYTGWASFFVETNTEDQLDSLASISDQFSLDFWIYPTLQHEGIVIVKPEHQDGFLKNLEDLGVSYRSHVADVKAQLDFEGSFVQKKRNASILRKAHARGKISYDQYQNIDTINEYMSDIAKNFTDKVKIVIAANSFEGRPIHYLKISITNFQNKSKPVIFIDGGIHAREWIAPATVTWAIKKLVENMTEPDLLERFDWILLLVVNPDGYVYSMTKSPLWRKTRSIGQHERSTGCPGVDGNRNYDYFWNQARTSSEPCDDNYAGSKAFSEIETRVVRDILQEHLDRMAMYISMHSSGSLILYPWSYDSNLSPSESNLRRVATRMAETIDRHALSYFFKYRVGQTPTLLYATSGTSHDYAHSLGVPLSYVFELPGYLDGFHLRPSYIEQVCRETWEGLVVGVRMAGDMFAGKLNQSTQHNSLSQT